jgi:hypothetical protein
MHRILVLLSLVSVSAVSLMLAGGSATGQSDGTPLTKEEYRQASLHVFNEESKSSALYYQLAVDPLPRAKCASGARRYVRQLSHMLAEAAAVVPPQEIAGLHAQLLSRGSHIVRGVRRQARLAKRGKVVCGEEVGHPVANALADRIYRVYTRSRFDSPLEQLYDLDYLPGGE